MGRWLARLQQDEKNTETLRDGTDKTDKTPSEPVLSVLSVRNPGKSAEFLPDDIEREERLAVYGEAEDDAAQERGEVAHHGRPEKVGGSDLKPTIAAPIRSAKESGKLVHSPNVSAGRFEDRPANWMPEPGPGVTILRPAVEVSAAEYDRHLDMMIAALPAGSPEAYRLTFAKKKGWCVDRGRERIFMRGRI
ncbi:hypothetical protein [Aureimonas psammosilenae]|uniref:hypothetical protein n=1 Tax=Aureimonas psammosilenae TaxID=2495496 RepID=UPI00126077B1|nr:hypothetical protein [Aureimonas psammosilenae]